MQSMKESEFFQAPQAWQEAQAAQIISLYSINVDPEVKKATSDGSNPLHYDQVVTVASDVDVEPFSSKVIHARTKVFMTEKRLNVMSQALEVEDQ